MIRKQNEKPVAARGHLAFRADVPAGRHMIRRLADTTRVIFFELFIRGSQRFHHTRCKNLKGEYRMKSKALKMRFALPVLIVGLLLPIVLRAQSATLSGTVTDAKGKPYGHVKVAIKAEKGTTAKTVQTDDDGNYSIPGLAPGDYSISASTQGMSSKQIKVTVTSAPHQTLDLLLTPEQGRSTDVREQDGGGFIASDSSFAVVLRA
jgi:hypothetical protein